MITLWQFKLLNMAHLTIVDLPKDGDFPVREVLVDTRVGPKIWGFPTSHDGVPPVIIHFERWDFP